LAAEAVDYYENYFKIKYPLPKLDLVALHKMKNRAMENWGCITVLTKILLNDP
jgi:aminopeptidase N